MNLEGLIYRKYFNYHAVTICIVTTYYGHSNHLSCMWLAVGEAVGYPFIL